MKTIFLGNNIFPTTENLRQVTFFYKNSIFNINSPTENFNLVIYKGSLKTSSFRSPRKIS